MIAGWLVYCVGVSALLAATAAAVDAILTRRGRPARWIWAATIAGSLGVPATALMLQQRTPAPLARAGEASSQSIIARATAIAVGAGGSARGAVDRRPRAPEVAGTDRFVVAFAIMCIVLAAVRVGVDSVLLYRSRRRWTRGVVDQVPVWLSADVGPAIVGLIEPIIVLPRWAEALAPDERALMLAHEREHLRAQDGRLTTAALLAIMSMPWNPIAWWALRRLRTAIEVDCDRRVLRTFPDISRYGRLLVDVAQRAVGSSFAIAGFSERAAPLARRIQAMTASDRPFKVLDMMTAGAGACAFVGAFALLPPAAPARPLPDFARFVQPLPKNVGDSIAEGEAPPKVVVPARDLPVEFALVEYGPSEDAKPLAARCAQRLRDARDDTRLLLSMSTTSTSAVVQRADTAWTRIESLGYYMVTPTGRYGVANEQTLRVGCGGYTRISVGNRDLDLIPGTTLGSRDDDRARRIGARLSADLRVNADAIELRRGRLNVVVADSTARVRDNEPAFARNTFAMLRDLLGASAVPETLAVSTRAGKDRWITSYHYWSMMK
jgi:hypothetical protein